jgi:transcriptional regulator with XRE-family HTH domain
MQDSSTDVATFLRLVGRRVATARERSGLTRTQLAADAGLPAETIAGLEQGEYGIDVDQLHRVADALRLATPDLLPDDAEVRHATGRGVASGTHEDPAGGRPAGS